MFVLPTDLTSLLLHPRQAIIRLALSPNVTIELSVRHVELGAAHRTRFNAFPVLATVLSLHPLNQRKAGHKSNNCRVGAGLTRHDVSRRWLFVLRARAAIAEVRQLALCRLWVRL